MVHPTQFAACMFDTAMADRWVRTGMDSRAAGEQQMQQMPVAVEESQTSCFLETTNTFHESPELWLVPVVITDYRCAETRRRRTARGRRDNVFPPVM